MENRISVQHLRWSGPRRRVLHDVPFLNQRRLSISVVLGSFASCVADRSEDTRTQRDGVLIGPRTVAYRRISGDGAATVRLG